jgi:hypothetical protein
LPTHPFERSAKTTRLRDMHSQSPGLLYLSPMRVIMGGSSALGLFSGRPVGLCCAGYETLPKG